MELSIGLNPVPASRPRVTKWGTYYGKRYSTWKKAAPFHLPSDPHPYFGKAHVAVCLEFIVNRPKTTKRSTPLGDTDNYAKAALDGVASIALTSTLGIGVIFSIVPLLFYQGGITLVAELAEKVLTGPVITEMNAVGGLLIVSIAIDLMGIRRLPVGNLLPSVLVVIGLMWCFGLA